MVPRHQSPTPAVSEKAVIKQAVVEIPLDLLRWVFTSTPYRDGAVERDRPSLSVRNNCRILPKIRAESRSCQRGVETPIVHKQCVIGLSSSQMSLVDKLPAQCFQNRLDESLFQCLLATVLRNSRLLYFPEDEQFFEDCTGFCA